MDAPPENGETPFIFMDGLHKAEPDKRKIIRKHVMLGKNRGKARKTNTKAPRDLGSPSTQLAGANESSVPVFKMRYPSIPKKVGNELSFTKFAAEVEPSLLQEMLRFCFMAKQVMYPLASCIDFHKNDKVDTLYFDLLTYDVAYFHSVIFLCQAYSSLFSGYQTRASACKEMAHYSEALRLLRRRLSGQSTEKETWDSTILIVLFLATHAHLVGHMNSANYHLQGLRKMTEIKGGIYAFAYNPKLIMELMKCDLAMAINHGTEPVFFADPSLEPLLPYDLTPPIKDTSPGGESPLQSVALSICKDLQQAWTAMGKFCMAINRVTKSKRRLPKEILLTNMGSVMYRIVRMKCELNSMDELIRLGLLAFSSHIFLRVQNVSTPHTYFPDLYRARLLSLRPGHTPSISLVWLLMVGGISLFTSADDYWLLPWLHSCLVTLGANNWEELRYQMKELLWIDTLHDKPGQAIYDTVYQGLGTRAFDPRIRNR